MKRQTAITSEGEGLTCGGGHAVDIARQDNDQQNHGDPCHGPVGQGQTHDVQKGIARKIRIIHRIRDVGNAKQERRQNDEAHQSVHQETRHDGTWNGQAGVFDFLGHMSSGIRA